MTPPKPPPIVPGEPRPGAPLVVVVGVVAATPGLGGLSWVTLNQAAGLAQAGCDVHVVDPVPAARRRPPGAPLAATANAAYFDGVVDRFGLRGRATLLCPETGETHGGSPAELAARCAAADVLLNTSGALRAPELVEPAPVRAYLDLDPGFTQLWALQGADVGLDGHTHFVTLGPLLGRPGCPVPTLGRSWIPLVPPVSLPHWPVRPARPGGPFSTVASWRGYGSIWHDGVHYGQKAHAARPLLDLPARTTQELCLALEIHPDEVEDIAALDRGGWRRVDPATVASSPEAFAEFVAGSKGELALAKLGYIEGRTGWFSDRSACYLASGRPVLAHDTGFAAHLPEGAGLVAFDGVESAADGLDRIGHDHAAHGAAARAVAAEHLDAGVVMRGLLDRLGVG
ncbi:MAG TPA: hypothetical protein VFW63_00170 [Acidimicrobiales bacterium]|nr:hypothetical protein [Acidimicrobiales bacterium]